MCCMDLEHGTSEPYSLENSLQCTSSLLQCLVEYRHALHNTPWPTLFNAGSLPFHLKSKDHLKLGLGICGLQVSYEKDLECSLLSKGKKKIIVFSHGLYGFSSFLGVLWRGREILPLDDVNAPLKSACHECEKHEKQCLKLHEQIQVVKFQFLHSQKEM